MPMSGHCVYQAVRMVSPATPYRLITRLGQLRSRAIDPRDEVGRRWQGRRRANASIAGDQGGPRTWEPGSGRATPCRGRAAATHGSASDPAEAAPSAPLGILVR
jgi:hypothetical protein